MHEKYLSELFQCNCNNDSISFNCLIHNNSLIKQINKSNQVFYLLFIRI